MVKPYAPGIEAQRTILLELRRREKADELPPGVRELARVTSMGYTTVRHHLGQLVTDGLVWIERGRGRLPGRVHLTAAGRRTGDLSTPPIIVG